ncbi:hypothetical protein ACAN107058_00225 [Paracidovorax anthurii]|uniref:Uncharacterized protein n=1 Tax=Paracidovorax anthurii TaxID=78229 RepID=A0A328ZMF5_9BURK|nr:hypothetical protein AX018_101442 [Paracidovorax anthurii]
MGTTPLMPVDVVPQSTNRDTQHVRQYLLGVPPTTPSLHSLSNLLARQLGFAPPSLPSRTSGTLPSNAALPDQFPFELSEHGQ